MSRRVNGEGPTPAALMLVGQKPGQMESRIGRPFVGPAGQELDRYLRNVGIDRSSCFVTNLTRTYDGVDDPTPEEIERDWPALMDEITRVSPRYIGLVGLYAVRAFLGDDVELDWANGLDFPDGDRTFMALTHPAAGLHVPAQAIRVMHGFEQLGKLVRGESLPTGHLSDTAITHYSNGNNIGSASTVGLDTEGTVESPWCYSFSNRAGHGVVCRDRYHAFSHVVVHNMLHDAPVLQSMGVTYRSYDDTMLMAALLGTEPHGLKALARRHCGMKMQEYSEIVREARRELALEYLANVVDWMPERSAAPPRKPKKPRKKRTLTEELESALPPLERIEATDADVPF